MSVFLAVLKDLWEFLWGVSEDTLPALPVPREVVKPAPEDLAPKTETPTSTKVETAFPRGAGEMVYVCVPKA